MCLFAIAFCIIHVLVVMEWLSFSQRGVLDLLEMLERKGIVADQENKDAVVLQGSLELLGLQEPLDLKDREDLP